jgi:hypothetical protein
MTPNAHFVSAAQRLKRCSRYKLSKQLHEYIRSDALHRSLAGMTPDQRTLAIRNLAEAIYACAPNKIPPPRLPNGKVCWNAATVAHFKREMTIGGLDRAAAALGLTKAAAKIALKRHVLPATVSR